jgi:ABC-type Na+ efflux pump permease subunit
MQSAVVTVGAVAMVAGVAVMVHRRRTMQSGYRVSTRASDLILLVLVLLHPYTAPGAALTTHSTLIMLSVLNAGAAGLHRWSFGTDRGYAARQRLGLAIHRHAARVGDAFSIAAIDKLFRFQSLFPA